jgi:hypothetical protein
LANIVHCPYQIPVQIQNQLPSRPQHLLTGMAPAVTGNYNPLEALKLRDFVKLLADGLVAWEEVQTELLGRMADETDADQRKHIAEMLENLRLAGMPDKSASTSSTSGKAPIKIGKLHRLWDTHHDSAKQWVIVTAKSDVKPDPRELFELTFADWRHAACQMGALDPTDAHLLERFICQRFILKYPLEVVVKFTLAAIDELDAPTMEFRLWMDLKPERILGDMVRMEASFNTASPSSAKTAKSAKEEREKRAQEYVERSYTKKELQAASAILKYDKAHVKDYCWSWNVGLECKFTDDHGKCRYHHLHGKCGMPDGNGGICDKNHRAKDHA